MAIVTARIFDKKSLEYCVQLKCVENRYFCPPLIFSCYDRGQSVSHFDRRHPFFQAICAESHAAVAGRVSQAPTRDLHATRSMP